MDCVINKLKEICEEHPFQEKIVIVDTYGIGEQMNEAFIKQGNKAINLKFKTVRDLAIELIELNSGTSLKVLEPTVGAHFTFSLLKELKIQNRLKYFGGMEITPSFSRAIFNTVQTLRLAGYSKSNLNKNAFLNDHKGQDFFEVLSAFEQLLDTLKVTDEAELYTKSIQFKHNNAIFIIQSNLQLSYVQEALLTSLLQDSFYILPVAPVFGVNPPERSGLRRIEVGNPTPLSYLYELDQMRETSDITIFSAKTEEIEVRNVLEKIKASKAKLDETVVYYTSTDPYITLFYHLSQKLEIPVTFGEGLPVSFSKPGRLVQTLIRWIKTNYSVQAFFELLHEGLLDLGEASPSKSKITRIVRDLEIGWGQERYLSQFEKEINILTEKKDYSNYEKKRLEDLTWLYNWLSLTFKKLPPFANELNYKKCLTGIAFILKNNCKTNSALDEVAKTAMLEELEKVLPYADEQLLAYDCFEKLNDLLLTIRVQKSRAKPGHLHISSYRNGMYNCRETVFLVGLDNQKFPGDSSEDPLLLDTERINLGNQLPLLREKGNERLYTLLQVLAHSTGKLCLSYCNFDIHANRVMSPAHVFLQCYRLATGNKEAEFKDVKTLPTSILPVDVFEEKDYWNTKISSEDVYELQEDLLEHFHTIVYGLEAERNRRDVNFTVYDGRVELKQDIFDPCRNQEKRMSAGKLELLAKCPYAYFLQEILRVKPVEELAYDPNKWLDPATRGSLLHSIFEKFYKQLKSEDQKPSFSVHEDMILSIACQLIQEQTDLLPPPNERVFEREKNDILHCCRIFLKEEEVHCEKYEPIHFEYSFGIGEVEPAFIHFPSGEALRISGIIDRVDQSLDGTYHIIDYKTGSTYGYRSNETFKGGRQLQHFIYALAIEQHLNLEQGSVQESAYYFPTVKGLAQRFVRKQDATLRTNGLDLLEKLIDVIKHGHFTMTDDENDCKFCDYKHACRRGFYDKQTLDMKQAEQKLKGVRIYE